MAGVLDALAQRRRVAGPVAMVVAHPDDETIGAGASLHLFDRLTLVHVTDGAPRNLADAHAAGFTDAAAYAAARRRELDAALEIGGARPHHVALGVADQGASAGMAKTAVRLSALFAERGIETVLTHAYEGGHPDHDATAFAVHAAAGLSSGPEVLEFAGYHAAPHGGMATGCFLPNGPKATVIQLDGRERAMKRRMLDCFATQRATLAPFGAEHEAFRPAPSYDFTAPPHTGTLHYEHYDWGMTGPAWRRLAAA